MTTQGREPREDVSHSAANQRRLEQVAALWQDLLEQTLVKGFFGTATIELNVQDGTIQHVRRRVEQIDK